LPGAEKSDQQKEKTMKAVIVSLTCAGLAFAGALSAGEVAVEHYGEDPALQMPFSDAVRVGDMLYLSGKIGNLPGTSELAPGGIQGETRQTMENIKASLEKYGSSLDEVVKCTVFLADMAEWGAMNEVYVTYFPTNKPARSALGVNGLALGARVEIECLAAMR
jgi:reactive intermediate/imine deaminase